MNIRLGFGCAAALLIAMMFASCTKEELFSAPVKKSDEINFGVNLKWDDDEVSTRSGVDYGNCAGSFMLRSEDSADSLAVNVYVKNTISESAPMTKGSVVENADAIADFDVYCSLDNGSETVPYFLNLEATQENGFWKPARDCYWPGSDFTKLKFLAVAPYEHGMTSTIASGSVMPTSFSYTVPEAAVDQNDIMMAVTGEYVGNYNQTVPVTFDHLLSAINVKIGSVPEGKIHSITLKGVGSSSTYTVADGTWATCTATDDFAVDFAGDGDTFATTGTETGNPQINAAEATFMMIPQTLGENASLEVVFTHTITNNNVTLTASLANVGWEKSKTYNYLINIEPDFTLSIEAENMSIADCHYDTRMITIKNLYHDVDWVLTSDSDWVKFRIVPDDFETNDNYIDFRNYWVENHSVRTIKVHITQTGSGIGADINSETLSDETVYYPIESAISGKGNAKVLVYFYENTGEAYDAVDIRSANLILYPKDNDSKANYFVVSQFYPIWNDGIAYERIEENATTHPWGFANDRKIKFTTVDTKPSWANSGWGALIWWIIDTFLPRTEAAFRAEGEEKRGIAYKYFYDTYYNTESNKASNFISITPSGGNGTLAWGEDNEWTATLDYANLNDVKADGTGLENTNKVLSYGGSVTGSDAETWLTSNNFISSVLVNSEDKTTIPETAVYQAVKKNAWMITTTQTITTATVNGENKEPEVSIVSTQSLMPSGIQWFLPSASEVATLLPTACDSDTNNNDTALSGTYWSSTSASGTNSISYDAAGTTSSASRTQKYKIRAARMKP